MSRRVHTDEVVRKQKRFLKRIWARHKSGYVFMAARPANTHRWIEKPLRAPADIGEAEEFLKRYNAQHNDLYFCPNAFASEHRVASEALRTPFAWCDIDDGDPDVFVPKPLILIESSPGRFQGLWEFEETAEASTAEAVSRMLAYNFGGDRNGWSITKYLRVPYTINHKAAYDRPRVRIVRIDHGQITRWPRARVLALSSTTAKCDAADDPDRYAAADVIEKYRRRMRFSRVSLMKHSRVLSFDRSRCIFMMVAELHWAGASRDEIAAVIWRSAYFRSKHGQDLNHLTSELTRILRKLLSSNHG